MAYASSLEEIRRAAEVIQGHAHLTPVFTSSFINLRTGRDLHFKCEVFQKGGAFKFRGACNAVFSLSEEDAAKGVVTHSSGNHAGCLALAAQMRGIPAYIVVPNTTPQVKQEAVKSYGAEITLCEPTIADRERVAAEIQERTGATLVPPYNFGPVISGQGTIALEFMEQVRGLEAIVVPVSGGGMISGIATAAKALDPSIRIIAAEPGGRNDAADVAASKAAGELVSSLPHPDTIADGLKGRMGDLTWPIVRDLVDEVVTVTEAEIVEAMRLVYERMKASSSVFLVISVPDQTESLTLASGGGAKRGGGPRRLAVS
mmetsp:Transcript_67131/g.212483  ORF Transcript_67131/g.212483 Transcript_67131/m.212483 type:complete len:316 (-) Transcript_67131:337-1284(-)